MKAYHSTQAFCQHVSWRNCANDRAKGLLVARGLVPPGSLTVVWYARAEHNATLLSKYTMLQKLDEGHRKELPCEGNSHKSITSCKTHIDNPKLVNPTNRATGIQI